MASIRPSALARSRLAPRGDRLACHPVAVTAASDSGRGFAILVGLT